MVIDFANSIWSLVSFVIFLLVRSCSTVQAPLCRLLFAAANHFISPSSFHASPNTARICLRSVIASPVNRPCLRAFWFAFGAPDPCALPCMRQRFLPCTAGERHAPPERVLAPQRGLASIGPVLLK